MNTLNSSTYTNSLIKSQKVILGRDFINQIEKTTQCAIFIEYSSLISEFANLSSKTYEISYCHHILLKSKKNAKSINEIYDKIADYMILDEKDNIVNCYTELINLTQKLTNLLKKIETFKLKKSHMFRKTEIVEIKFEETSKLEDVIKLLKEKNIKLVNDKNEAMKLYPEMFDKFELLKINNFFKNLSKCCIDIGFGKS